MRKVRFSRSAKDDLHAIGVYTIQRWGLTQASRYLAELHETANRIATHANMGHACDWIRPGLRRFEKGSHILFYRRLEDGIFILRILHKSMLPELHSFADLASSD